MTRFPFPPIPKTIPGALGPIPVRRVRRCVDEHGRQLGGRWFQEQRRIDVKLGCSREAAWFYLLHEKAHADFDEGGVVFPGPLDAHGDNPLEEAACNAIASAGIRAMHARFPCR